MPQNKNILANSFKSFESLVTQWRMFVKMTVYIILGLAIVHLIILAALLQYKPEVYFKGFTGNDRCIFRTYVVMGIRYKMVPISRDFTFTYTCEGGKHTLRYDHFLNSFRKYFEGKLLRLFKRNVRTIMFMTCPLYLLYGVFLLIFSFHYRKSVQDRFMRGKQSIREDVYANLLARYPDRISLRINRNIAVAEKFFTKHCFSIGATGSGKSQLAFRIVEQLIQHNIRCIIHDFKGDFIPTFYDPSKHYIFNPLDTRHMGLTDTTGIAPKGWTLFNELQTLPNVDSFTSSMIPDGPGDQIFYTGPRDLLKAMIIYCIKNNLKTNADLNAMIETSPDRLRELFRITPGCKVGLKHLEEQKLAGQFLSILATYTASLSYLVGTDGDFSITHWIADRNTSKRIIFLANQAEVQKTLKTLISTFFDFSIKALCSLPDDPDRRRVYFILDEFGQLSKMDSVVQLLTQGRSKGASTWIFIQDIAQIDNIYGKNLSKTIVNGCRNKFYFSVADHDTAKFISDEVGHYEIERTREGKSFGVSDLKDSINTHTEIVERPIAMPSEISSQKNLSFFLQLADIPQLTHVSIEYRKYPVLRESYQPRDIRVETYCENERSGDFEKSLHMTPSKDPDQVLFEELSKAPPESQDTLVHPDEIPDMNGGLFVPENNVPVNQETLITTAGCSEKPIRNAPFF